MARETHKEVAAEVAELASAEKNLEVEAAEELAAEEAAPVANMAPALGEPSCVVGDPHPAIAAAEPPSRFKKTVQVNIIVDSPGDFNPQVVEAMGVTVIPFTYVVDGQEYYDDLWHTTTAHDFYEKMRHGMAPTTAAIAPGRYYEIFKQAAEAGMPTVYFAFTASLSSSFYSAQTAAQMIAEEYPDFELYVIDNLCPSAAAELLALEAVHQARMGATAKDLVAWAEEARYFIHGFFTLDSFDALARGGRIPPQAASLGGKLDIKPELTYDVTGALQLKKLCRGRKKAMRAIIEDFKEMSAGETSMPVAIVTSDANKDAQKLEEMLRKEPGCEGITVIHSQVSPVIGAHVGPDMLALIFWGKDRRERSNLSDRIAKKVGIGR
jgi:DegV family protein with EDD domain